MRKCPSSGKLIRRTRKPDLVGRALPERSIGAGIEQNPKQDSSPRVFEIRLAENAKGVLPSRLNRVPLSELALLLFRDYKINRRKTLKDVQMRWHLHLQPFFGDKRCCSVTTDQILQYVEHRLEEGAKNATVNRELAIVKRMYKLGAFSAPALAFRTPRIPTLREDNVRTGFLDESQYRKLIAANPSLWFRAITEVARTYGWRKAN